jgi:four helix bundle protein
MENKRTSAFETLEIWIEGRELRKSFSVLVKTFPPEEKYRLTDQIVRASRSVTNNIAEGHGRFHYREYIQFCRHSHGSLYELLDQICIASDENYIDDKIYNDFKDKINTIIRKVNGFISYLKKQKEMEN